jgi:hypothetical protein
MAATTRMVTYAEWLEHGRYPGGGKFDPNDNNLRSYYDSYVSQWQAGSDALRQQLNSNHGLSAWNSAANGNGAWSGRHAPSTVASEVVAPAYTRPGLLDWSQYMPEKLGKGYLDPEALASQQALMAGQGKYYQPWAEGALTDTGASNLWQYTPPATSLFGWPEGTPMLSIPPASSFYTTDDSDDDDNGDDENGDDENGNTDDTGSTSSWTNPNTGEVIYY